MQTKFQALSIPQLAKYSKTTLSYHAALTLKDSGASIAAFCILHAKICQTIRKNIFKHIPMIWEAQVQG